MSIPTPFLNSFFNTLVYIANWSNAFYCKRMENTALLWQEFTTCFVTKAMTISYINRKQRRYDTITRFKLIRLYVHLSIVIAYKTTQAIAQ